MAEKKQIEIEKEANVVDEKIQTKKDDKVEIKKEQTKPAVEKKTSKKKSEPKIEIEREYIVPLKKGVLKAPQYRRAKKAIRVLKEFMVRHMKVRDRDLRKVKIDIYLNNELWFKGIKKPANKIKVKAKKIDGIVYVELADIPKAVKFIMDREARKKSELDKTKKSKPEKNKENGVKNIDKETEKEDIKATKEKSISVKKSAANASKHTTKGSHIKKTMPIRNIPKK